MSYSWEGAEGNVLIFLPYLPPLLTVRNLSRNRRGGGLRGQSSLQLALDVMWTRFTRICHFELEQEKNWGQLRGDRTKTALDFDLGSASAETKRSPLLPSSFSSPNGEQTCK